VSLGLRHRTRRRPGSTDTETDLPLAIRAASAPSITTAYVLVPREQFAVSRHRHTRELHRDIVFDICRCVSRCDAPKRGPSQRQYATGPTAACAPDCRLGRGRLGVLLLVVRAESKTAATSGTGFAGPVTVAANDYARHVFRGRGRRIVAMIAIAGFLVVPSLASAHVTRLFPGKTVLATKDDVATESGIRPKPRTVTSSFYNVVGFRVRWSGWGSRRAVGHGTIDSVARGLRGTITFVASRPRVVETPSECVRESGLASLREYTQLSFRVRGITSSGQRYTYKSHSNLASTRFPFDC
jgi:hypothetical protein